MTNDLYNDFYNRLGEMRNLERGWDGYKAAIISPESIDLASSVYEDLRLSLGDNCQVVPDAGGALQLEWHEKDYKVEVFISAGGGQ